jgi:uncharacterized membrane protein
VAVGAAAGMAGYAWGRLASHAILARDRTASRKSGGIGGVRSYRYAATINRPLDEVYGFWRDLPGLARTAEHVVRVDDIGDRRSRWIVDGPGSSELEFVVEIVADEPGRLIVWRTEESPMPHEGRVAFSRAPGGRGTEIRVETTGLPATDDLGAIIVSLTGAEPDQLVRDAVRRVKQVLEAGEVIVADGTSTGRDRPVRKQSVREQLVRKQTVPVGGPA